MVSIKYGGIFMGAGGFAVHPENINRNLGSRPNPFKRMIRNILEGDSDWLEQYMDPGMTQKEKMSALEAVVRNAIRLAVSPRNSRTAIEAMRFIAEYSVGKPVQQMDLTINADQEPYDDMSEEELAEEMRKLDGDVEVEFFAEESDKLPIRRGGLEDASQYKPYIPESN